MAEPLPDGWVDTGVRGDVSLYGKVQVRMPWAWATIGHWSISSQGVYGGPLSCHPPTPVCMGSQVVLRGQFLGVPAMVIEEHYHCASGSIFPDVMSQPFVFTEESGPYRLGMRYRQIDPNNFESPQFAQRDYIIDYSWFADGQTTFRTFGHLWLAWTGAVTAA